MERPLPVAASVAGQCAAPAYRARRTLRWKLGSDGGRVATGALSIRTASAVRRMAPADEPALGRHLTADAGDVGTRGSGEDRRGSRADRPSQVTARQVDEV